MRLHLVCCGLLLTIGNAWAQYAITLQIIDDKTKEPVIGAAIFLPATNRGGTTDALGQVRLTDIPAGPQILRISSLNYRTKEKQLIFPRPDSSRVEVIDVEPSAIELTGVVVSATRTDSRIEDSPVRVEVLGLEEIEEKTGMKPANIAMLLAETAGVQVQQTSPVSANQAIRLQGLDGRYTQLLKDGFPLYSGLATGLSLIQIPPLDLKQVELIKGSSSALYGGDAIAGIINLVSKQPGREPEFSAILNGTHKGAADVSAWYGARGEKLGVTMLATHNTQRAYDVDGDGFTDLPKFRLINLNPRLFWYVNEETTVTAGVNLTFDDRTDGDLRAIQEGPTPAHLFTERNQSNRTFTTFQLDRRFDGKGVFRVKNSVNWFNRTITLPGSQFAGRQAASFSEVSYLLPTADHTTVFGGNAWTDQFTETTPRPITGSRNYAYTTLGAFVQDDWRLTNEVTLQMGLRTDHQNQYGWFVLPRFSALWKMNGQWSARVGGGLGYKLPTIFSTDTERSAYADILPLTNDLKAETSHGLNADLNYNTRFDEIGFAVNQSFFYTQINQPLVLQTLVVPPNSPPGSMPQRVYQNAGAPIITRGFETNLKASWEDWKLVVAYSFTDARRQYEARNDRVEFAPKHKLVTTLIYEKEKSFRAGLEGFYTGRQHIGGGEYSPAYWIMGLMAEKMFQHFSIVGNLENFTDTRQTRFETILVSQQTPGNPLFRPIYAPLDGFIANIALRIRF